MHDGVEAGEVVAGDVTDVADAVVELRRCTEVAPVEEPAVEPDHLVAGLLEEWHQSGTDVPAVAGDEDAHDQLHTFHGGSPESHSFSSSFLSRNVSMHCQNPEYW